MTRNWNQTVTNNDVIYHIGDFGNPDIISELNGKIIYVIPGNYDTQEVLYKLSKDKRIIILNNNCTEILRGSSFKLIHIPKDAVDGINNFYLFGHIHNTQKIKRNGLNVGVDCHNFKPISLDTVLFYKNAVKTFYDENVFLEIIGYHSEKSGLLEE
jgi:calcineurin-like phosphoesterase family protein